MRVFAVPSGSPSSAATCSCVRSSRKARLIAWRCGAGSSSNADWMRARRCRRDATSAGPRSARAGHPRRAHRDRRRSLAAGSGDGARSAAGSAQSAGPMRGRCRARDRTGPRSARRRGRPPARGPRRRRGRWSGRPARGSAARSGGAAARAPRRTPGRPGASAPRRQRRAPSMPCVGFRSCERTSVGPDDASRHPLHRAGGSGLVHRPTPGSPPPSASGVRRKSGPPRRCGAVVNLPGGTLRGSLGPAPAAG